MLVKALGNQLDEYFHVYALQSLLSAAGWMCCTLYCYINSLLQLAPNMRSDINRFSTSDKSHDLPKSSSKCPQRPHLAAWYELV